MKKICSLLMAMVLCVSATVPVSVKAMETQAVIETPSETEMLAEIEAVKAEVFDSVFCQLEEQGMVSHLPIYMEVLAPQIELGIRLKYNSQSTYSTNATATIAMPYGGMVAYYSALGNEVVSMYLGRNDADEYIDKRHVGTMADIFLEITGIAIPSIAVTFRLLTAAQMAMTTIGRNNVDRANGYGHIMKVAESVS